jgi:hypothetical protein
MQPPPFPSDEHCDSVTLSVERHDAVTSSYVRGATGHKACRNATNIAKLPELPQPRQVLGSKI